jgi:hypothetical protein
MKKAASKSKAMMPKGKMMAGIKAKAKGAAMPAYKKGGMVGKMPKAC